MNKLRGTASAAEGCLCDHRRGPQGLKPSMFDHCMNGLKAVPFKGLGFPQPVKPVPFEAKVLYEEVPFGFRIQMIVGRLFPHNVHARAQTVEDAVYLPHGDSDSLFNRVDSVG